MPRALLICSWASTYSFLCRAKADTINAGLVSGFSTSLTGLAGLVLIPPFCSQTQSCSALRVTKSPAQSSEETKAVVWPQHLRLKSAELCDGAGLRALTKPFCNIQGLLLAAAECIHHGTPQPTLTPLPEENPKGIENRKVLPWSACVLAPDNKVLALARLCFTCRLSCLACSCTFRVSCAEYARSSFSNVSLSSSRICAKGFVCKGRAFPLGVWRLKPHCT